MTGLQMIQSFLQYYDRVTNYTAPGYENSEILLFLNNAQDEFIRNILYGKENQFPILQGNQRLEADLFSLITTKSISNTDISVGNWINHFKFNTTTTIPTARPLQYFVDLLVTLTRTYPTVSSGYKLSCEHINPRDASKFAYIEGINKPHFINPVYWIETYLTIGSKEFNFMVDSYSTKSAAWLVYTAPPKVITAAMTEFDNTYTDGIMSLPSHTHQMIVDIAVRQALQAMQDTRYQTQLAEQQIKNE